MTNLPRECYKAEMAVLTPEMNSLLLEIRLLAASAATLHELQQGIVKAIPNRLASYHWTGFYMLDPADAQTLVLGPFTGDPTPHLRISVTQGICGAAVASGETIIVDDVNDDPRYLSCSLKTRSEIVVPIRVHGNVVGEIDIDSHNPAAFTSADRSFLESVAHLVGIYMEGHPERPPAG